MKDNTSNIAIEFSIVMPCLNEAKTLAECIRKAQQSFRQLKINGEVIVADNGSSDGCPEIALSEGAKVVYIKAKGYGNALRGGISSARGKYILMGDADCSYDFSSISEFVEKLRDGYDLVMGNRFKGGILPGAMCPLHYYIGNPVLSGIGRLFFHSNIGDFHCGLRGFSRLAYDRIAPESEGMEFASELVVKASQGASMNPTRPSLRCSVLTWAVALLALFLLVACVQPHNPAPTGGGSPLPTPTTVVLPTPAPEVRDSQAWAQTELLGISFKYLNGSVITDTTTPDNQPDDEMRWEHILIAGWDLFFNVGASTGVDASYVADDAYPYNIPSDPGPWRYYFPAQIEVEGATKAWLLVIGARDAETKEWVAVYSELGPYATLNAIVYNETCVASISFESSFDLADTQQVEATSLAQVVTERYPVFDQMVHSVRFPEECTDEQP